MVALAEVPGVVGPLLAFVYLFPSAWPTSLMKKRVPVASGSKAKRKGLRKPQSESLLADLADVGAAGDVAAGAVCSRVGVGRGDVAVAGYAQDLAQEDVRVAGGVVLTCAARVARVVAAPSPTLT